MTTDDDKKRVFIPFLLGGIIFAGLFFIMQKNYLLFHGIIEVFSIVVAYCIFIIAWNTRNLHENSYFIFIGIAYFFVGSLDLLHTLSYKGMWVFPSHGGNLAIEIWIAARYLESLSLLAAPFYLRKKLHIPSAFSFYILYFTLVLLAIFYWDIFPDCFVEETGLTLFKKFSEYTIALILLGAGTYLYSCRDLINRFTFQTLLVAIACAIAAELFFTFYISLYGLSNALGHFCKLLSFYFIYKALVETGLQRPMQLLFLNLEKNRQELQESQERYQIIFDNAPFSIAYLDSQLRVIQINDQMECLTDCRSGNVTGRFCYDVWGQYAHDTSKKGDERICDTCMAKKALHECRSYTHERQVGARYMLVTTTPVQDDNGKVIGVLETSKDLTERKQAEDALARAMKELTTANQELEQYNNVVAHDLKAPFRAISNYNRFLQDELSSIVNQEQGVYLDKMGKAVGEAGRLIEDLLLVARIRQKERTEENVDLGLFLRKLCDRLELSADVEVILADTWPTLVSDSLLLQQIFQNLIENGAKYNHSAKKRIEIGWSRSTDGSLDVTVRDNGIGIDPRYHQQIFRIFERLHSSAEYSGTGVGLAIARKAVENLGGEICLESAVGEGSCFHLVLPAGEF